MHTHTHTRGFTTEVDPCFLSPDTSPLMIAPQDMCIVCVCVCAKEQHSGFICFPFLLSMMQSHSKSLTPIWFPYWLVSLFFLLSLIIQVYGGGFSYFSGGFLSLCSFDFILHGLRKLFNMKITTKRSKHNQSPKKWSVIQSRHGHTRCAFQGQILSLKYPSNIFLSVKNILSLPERSFWDKGRLFPHQTGVGTQHHLVIYYKVNTCTSTVCIISPYNSPLSLLFLHV